MKQPKVATKKVHDILKDAKTETEEFLQALEIMQGDLEEIQSLLDGLDFNKIPDIEISYYPDGKKRDKSRSRLFLETMTLVEYAGMSLDKNTNDMPEGDGKKALAGVTDSLFIVVDKSRDLDFPTI